MDLELFELIEKLIDAKIEYEFALREEGSDGHRNSALSERMSVERIKDIIVNRIVNQ